MSGIDIKDWLGQDIEPNSLVLYTVAYGASAVELRFGRVVTLGVDDDYTNDNQVLVQWVKTSKHSLPDSPETWVRKDKLTVMSEDMAELLGRRCECEHTIDNAEDKGESDE